MAERRTVTIAEAAALTGLSRQAITRRVERGQIPARVVDRRRRVAVADLVRLGLVRDRLPEPEPGRRGDVDGALERLEDQAAELLGAIAAVRVELAAERAGAA